MPIYLIRHGQSAFNAAHSGDAPDPMIFDAPLTAKGVDQAKQARNSVLDLGIRLVICSPLTRALQTARHIFDGIAPIRVMAGAREKLSHSGDVGRSPKALQADFPGLSFAGLDDIWWHHGLPNTLGYTVEPHKVFAQRVRVIATSLANMTPRPIAVVGHGDMFREMVGYVLDNCEICWYSG
jgi:broad specificity phosphatase PhoE